MCESDGGQDDLMSRSTGMCESDQPRHTKLTDLGTGLIIVPPRNPAPVRMACGRIPGIGAWRSLVAHLLWEQRVGGSNPSAPTSISWLFGEICILK